jgi:hypothetical protein
MLQCMATWRPQRLLQQLQQRQGRRLHQAWQQQLRVQGPLQQQQPQNSSDQQRPARQCRR